MKLTTVFVEIPGGYVGFVEELPGANTQGKTLEETRENLYEAIDLVLAANRDLSEETLNEESNGLKVIREELLFAAA